MKMPDELIHEGRWVLVGPMGPELPEKFAASPILAVDGGAHFTNHMTLWVGDSDSYTEAVNCPHVFQFPPEKDSSDLALALKLFSHLDQGIFHMWGFLGGRRDHELLNFGVVMEFLEHRSDTSFTFYDSQGEVKVTCHARGNISFEHQGVFSLITMKPVKIKLRGECQYPVAQETELKPFSSWGLSNMGQGQMLLEAQGPVMVMLP